MTLVEAQNADKILMVLQNEPKHKSLSLAEIFSITRDIHVLVKQSSIESRSKMMYTALLVSDGYIKKTRQDNGDLKYSLTDSGIAFILFKGGYTKKVKEQLKEKSARRRKEYFEIGKDILLILLSSLSLYLGIS